mgnify:CR=1 FL=1
MAPLMSTSAPIPAVSDLREQVAGCLLRDRRRLRRRLRELDERDADTADWLALAQAIARSRTLAEARAAGGLPLPPPARGVMALMSKVMTRTAYWF